MTTLANLDMFKMRSSKLSPRQKIFARNLASGMSQTDAAIEAGYSVNRAKVTGCELVQKPEVQAELIHTRSEIETALGISPQWCAERYLRLAEQAVDGGEIHNSKGCLDSLSKLMGWDVGNKNITNEIKSISVESILEKLNY